MDQDTDRTGEAVEAAAAEAVETAATTEEAAALKARLEAAEAEVARMKDERLRALAEVENTRRRAARDRQDASQYAISSFARDLLTVADNLERALGSVTPEMRENDPQLDALMGGVEATERALKAIFERYAINPIAAHGEPFDPHVHEAMFEIPDDSVPHGTVVQVLEPGYTIHERTLRPARVGVARGGPKAAPTSGAGEGEDKLSFTAGNRYAQPANDETESGSRVDERS